MSHLSVCFSHPSRNTITIELHHGARKNVATLRTVKTLINNLIIGVTKGFKYKMRYVYAHFPINVNIEKNSETGLYDVEIRYFMPMDFYAECDDLGFTMLTHSANKKLHRREDYSTSHHVTRCRRGSIEKPERRTTAHRQLARECFSERRGHSTDMPGQEQGYPQGKAVLPLNFEHPYLTLLQFLDGLYVSERGNIEDA